MSERTSIEQIIWDIGGRFRSGNQIPVERVHVTRAEWRAVCDELDRLNIALGDAYEALQSIAANACCDGCQEAALVARKALRMTDVEYSIWLDRQLRE